MLFRGKCVNVTFDNVILSVRQPKTSKFNYCHMIYTLTNNMSVWELLNNAWLFATPWTVACQAPLSMEFSRQDYWSGLPFPSHNIGTYNLLLCNLLGFFFHYFAQFFYFCSKITFYKCHINSREFPGSPIVRTWCFHWCGPRFSPWLWN